MPALPALQLLFVLQRHALPRQLKPVGQTCPHAPQLAELVTRSAQPLAQHVRVAEHARPPLQVQSPVALQSSPRTQTMALQWQSPVISSQVSDDELVPF